MPDEFLIFSKLGSWVYGSMIHATGVLSRTFEADLSAIRIYGVQGHEYSSYVDTARLGLDAWADQKVQSWPVESDALFERIKGSGRREGIFSPDVLFDESDLSADDSKNANEHTSKDRTPVDISNAGQRASLPEGQSVMQGPIQLELFQGLGKKVQVQECLCMSMHVYGEIWAAVALMRVQNSKPFVVKHHDLLEKIKPAIVHILRSGCTRQGLTVPPKVTWKLGKKDNQLSTDQIIAKLTRTECQVLAYLRLAVTEREISKEIHRSPHTVHVHVKNIYRKLDVNSRSELIELFGDTQRD